MSRPRGEEIAANSAVVLLWLTLDWPIGPIGTGYLASVHALQFVSLAVVVPALMLWSARRSLRDRGRIGLPRPLQRIGRLAVHPINAAVLFSVIMFLTHAPRVVDAFMGQQLGAFALDASWFGAGILFWWPVIVRRPEQPLFNPLLQMLYVFFGTQAHLGVAMWLLIAEFPVYATYELAPRITSVSAATDQQLAGAIMIGVLEPIVMAAVTLLFFHWSNRTLPADGPLAVPTAPHRAD